MTQSNLLSCDPQPRGGLHVAIIMDGNGRWATRRGLPRTAGHRAGVETVRRVVESAPELGIATLTLFAFSSDNWRRPTAEVEALMWLLEAYLRSEVHRLVESGVRLSVIGRRDRLARRLVRQIEGAERLSAEGSKLHLRVALDYSAREAIVRAAARWEGGLPPSLEQFGRLVSEPQSCGGPVDLLIRTGGEKRLSDFLLWESAYAELWFSDLMWPEFDTAALASAVADFRRRDRRFGGLTQAALEPIVATAAGD
jgi:undecaprenyl diphosphate synthase